HGGFGLYEWLGTCVPAREIASIDEHPNCAKRRLLSALKTMPRRPASKGDEPVACRGLANCTNFESRGHKISTLHDGPEAGSGSSLNMPAVAEHICQACGKVTWRPVPTRTDTMPACACGGGAPAVLAWA